MCWEVVQNIFSPAAFETLARGLASLNRDVLPQVTELGVKLLLLCGMLKLLRVVLALEIRRK